MLSKAYMKSGKRNRTIDISIIAEAVFFLLRQNITISTIDKAKLAHNVTFELSPKTDNTAPLNSIIRIFKIGINAETTKTAVNMSENLILDKSI